MCRLLLTAGGHKTKREIRRVSLFREMPPEFLRMIVVHELAHMEQEYGQLEFDLRVYLSYLDTGAVGADLIDPFVPCNHSPTATMIRLCIKKTSLLSSVRGELIEP